MAATRKSIGPATGLSVSRYTVANILCSPTKEGDMKARTISLLALVAILLPLLASAAPSSASVVASQVASTRRVSFNGISFTYDNSLASDVATSVVPEDKGDANSACWYTHPDETVFEFKDFAYSTGRAWASIYVFPVNSDYRCLNPSETIDYWGREVAALRDLLARRPKLVGPAGAQGPF